MLLLKVLAHVFPFLQVTLKWTMPQLSCVQQVSLAQVAKSFPALEISTNLRTVKAAAYHAALATIQLHLPLARSVLLVVIVLVMAQSSNVLVVATLLPANPLVLLATLTTNTLPLDQLSA